MAHREKAFRQIHQLYNNIIITATSRKQRRCTKVGAMLAHRLRRWTNINPTLVQHLHLLGVFAGLQLKLSAYYSFPADT